MMAKPGRFVLALCLGLLVLSIVVAGCQYPQPDQPTPPSPTEKPERPTIPPGELPPFDPDGERCITLKAGQSGGQTTSRGHYVNQQVIVSGPRAEIDRLIAELDVSLQPMAVCYLYYPSPKSYVRRDTMRPGERSGWAEPPPWSNIQDKVETRLYFIDGDSESEQPEVVVKRINELGQSVVFADPNYLVGPQGASPCGNPFEMEGSPFEMEGSPFEMEGSGQGGPGSVSDETTFWNQWAFKTARAGRVYSQEWRQPELAAIRVGVFDTSPFSSAGQTRVKADSASFALTVHDVPILNRLEPAPGSPGGDASEHGTMVAGLVNAVAPVTDIHLYPVLNKYGCGDLFSLIVALNGFVDSVVENKGQGRAVANLSLGVHQPRNVEKYRVPAEVVSLEEAVSRVYNNDIVVVAAAGNSSAEIEGDGEAASPDLPADFPYVVGVSASNIYTKPSCYSNRGDVAAPGGDGQLTPSESCLPRSADCDPADTQCPFGVISTVSENGGGLRFWVGSSFSAPIVSGQAARLLQEGVNPADVGQELAESGSHYGSPDPVLGSGVTNHDGSLP
ncbi:MAG: S8/S53 family peptidase [Chloroflexota bacterium]|nr:S8/S53 family peptidase [Chloroflexota bacterium]